MSFVAARPSIHGVPDVESAMRPPTLSGYQSGGSSVHGSAVPPSYWDFGERKEDPIHRIHAYPAKFPAFITTKALRYAQQAGVSVDLIADVFCGCGTTAVESMRSGKNFWGCDINPVATLIAQVKTRHYSDAGLRCRIDAIKSLFESCEPTTAELAAVSKRIKYWFSDRNTEDLLRLRRAINRVVPNRSRYRKFFLCAFSNILKPTSRWLTRSIKPQVDPNKPHKDVMDAFASQVAQMRMANRREGMAASSSRPGTINLAGYPAATIRNRDFLASRPPNCRPDLIVTSPPYVTSYNYADIHQLSALWLGFASDYRDLRKNMIGNEYQVRPLTLPEIERLGPCATDTYHSLTEKDPRRARSVARYFSDMDKTVVKCWKMLKNGGMAIFVIGNTRYSGVTIDNQRHLTDRMTNAGFRAVTEFKRRVSLKIMTPYRDARGRFTDDSSQRRVYGEEFVVIGRRP